jgi:hypothetical protein
MRRTGTRENFIQSWARKPQGKNHSEDLEVDGKIANYSERTGWHNVEWIPLRYT